MENKFITVKERLPEKGKDIIIVEKNDGIVMTIPNKEKYYKFIN